MMRGSSVPTGHHAGAKAGPHAGVTVAAAGIHPPSASAAARHARPAHVPAGGCAAQRRGVSPPSWRCRYLARDSSEGGGAQAGQPAVKIIENGVEVKGVEDMVELATRQASKQGLTEHLEAALPVGSRAPSNTSSSSLSSSSLDGELYDGKAPGRDMASTFHIPAYQADQRAGPGGPPLEVQQRAVERDLAAQLIMQGPHPKTHVEVPRAGSVWSTQLLAGLWPWIRRLLEEATRSLLPAVLSASKPPWLGDINMESVDLGTVPPTIKAIQILPMAPEDQGWAGIVLEVELEWASKCDTQFKLQLIPKYIKKVMPDWLGDGLLGLAEVQLGVTDFAVTTHLMVRLAPLGSALPIIRAVQLSFVQPLEYIDFKLTVSEERSTWPTQLLQPWLLDVLRKASQAIALPEQLTLAIDAPALPFPPVGQAPAGVLLVRVVRGQNLPVRQAFQSEPLVAVHAGVRKRCMRTTSYIDLAGGHPEWDRVTEAPITLLVHYPQHQTLRIEYCEEDHAVLGTTHSVRATATWPLARLSQLALGQVQHLVVQLEQPATKGSSPPPQDQGASEEAEGWVEGPVSGTPRPVAETRTPDGSHGDPHTVTADFFQVDAGKPKAVTILGEKHPHDPHPRNSTFQDPSPVLSTNSEGVKPETAAAAAARRNGKPSQGSDEEEKEEEHGLLDPVSEVIHTATNTVVDVAKQAAGAAAAAVAATSKVVEMVPANATTTPAPAPAPPPTLHLEVTYVPRSLAQDRGLHGSGILNLKLNKVHIPRPLADECLPVVVQASIVKMGPPRSSALHPDNPLATSSTEDLDWATSIDGGEPAIAGGADSMGPLPLSPPAVYTSKQLPQVLIQLLGGTPPAALHPGGKHKHRHKYQPLESEDGEDQHSTQAHGEADSQQGGAKKKGDHRKKRKGDEWTEHEVKLVSGWSCLWDVVGPPEHLTECALRLAILPSKPSVANAAKYAVVTDNDTAEKPAGPNPSSNPGPASSSRASRGPKGRPGNTATVDEDDEGGLAIGNGAADVIAGASGRESGGSGGSGAAGPAGEKVPSAYYQGEREPGAFQDGPPRGPVESGAGIAGPVDPELQETALAMIDVPMSYVLKHRFPHAPGVLGSTFHLPTTSCIPGHTGPTPTLDVTLSWHPITPVIDLEGALAQQASEGAAGRQVVQTLLSALAGETPAQQNADGLRNIPPVPGSKPKLGDPSGGVSTASPRGGHPQ